VECAGKQKVEENILTDMMGSNRRNKQLHYEVQKKNAGKFLLPGERKFIKNGPIHAVNYSLDT
jgi:hypothetical protein